MIGSYDEMRQYQRADLRMHGRARLTMTDILETPHIRWVWLLRVSEYITNCWDAEPMRSVGRVVRLLIRRNGSYAPGIMAFSSILDGWRNEGKLEGIRFDT